MNLRFLNIVIFKLHLETTFDFRGGIVLTRYSISCPNNVLSAGLVLDLYQILRRMCFL